MVGVGGTVVPALPGLGICEDKDFPCTESSGDGRQMHPCLSQAGPVLQEDEGTFPQRNE